MGYKRLSSHEIHKSRAFAVRRDLIEFPDGRSSEYDIVVHIGAVAIVPLTADGQILFVRQYRPAAERALLELPAGTLSPGEPPEACAQRELREEVSMAPGWMEKLADFFLAPGYSTERMHIYIAGDLRPESLPHDDDEELEVESLTLDEAFAAVKSGAIEDAKTIVGLQLARDFLQSRKP
jgi:ADP-ribose pyrophosphatase